MKREAEKSRAAALIWWGSLDRHVQWLTIERWRGLKQPGWDWPTAIIITSSSMIERIWEAEKGIESGKAAGQPGEESES